MNKIQTSKLDSLKLIVKESKINPESIAKVPKFGVIVNRIDEICNEVDALQIEQEKDLTGITIDKDKTLDNLSDMTIEIAGAVYSYAHDNNNNALMARVNFKATLVGNMSQQELIAASGIVLEEATKISPEKLANEGISPEELIAYRDLTTYFSSIRSSKRVAVIDRSGVTEKLGNLFEEAGSLVKNKLDRLAVQFKRKDPEFYLKYKAARTVQYPTAPKKETENEPAPIPPN